MNERFFVAGTDTGVGKTQVSCALLSLLAERGRSPAPFKPYETGCEPLNAPADALAMRAAARSSLAVDAICPHRFRLPLAPGVAGARLKRQPSFARTLSACRRLGTGALVVEAAGGLRVPIDGRRDVLDLIAALELPVVLVARAGLGTLNHTALSIDALHARDISIRAVVLAQSSPHRDPSERDNAAWIRRRHRITVLGPVPFTIDPARRAEAFRRALRPLID